MLYRGAIGCVRAGGTTYRDGWELHACPDLLEPHGDGTVSTVRCGYGLDWVIEGE